MNQIRINTDINAPGCPCEIQGGPNFSESYLVQSDWEFPGFASAFGWNIRGLQRPGMFCPHSGTDGTVDCSACGITVGEFIASAYDFLIKNDGLTADDPGYF